MERSREPGQDLQHALAAAEAASVAPDLLEQGRRRLSQLLEQLKAEQKRKAAEEALQAAMAAEIIGPLEMAVARAEAADVKPEVVAAAEQLLWQLQEKEESATWNVAVRLLFLKECLYFLFF